MVLGVPVCICGWQRIEFSIVVVVVKVTTHWRTFTFFVRGQGWQICRHISELKLTIQNLSNIDHCFANSASFLSNIDHYFANKIDGGGGNSAPPRKNLVTHKFIILSKMPKSETFQPIFLVINIGCLWKDYFIKRHKLFIWVDLAGKEWLLR
jgi:hypothetical protein